MKRIITIVLAVMMMLTLVACGSENTNTPAESGNNESQQTTAQNEQSTTADEQTSSSASDSVLDLCGLKEDDIKTSAVESVGEPVKSSSQYMVDVIFSEGSFEEFEAWLNELADTCRKASLDGKLYSDEISWKEVNSFNLEQDAINVQQFIYKTTGHVVYVTATQGTVDNGCNCNIQVY